MILKGRSVEEENSENQCVDRVDLIRQRLTDKLEPSQLSIVDDSHLHEGHEEAEKSGGGHFSIDIVSQHFIEKSAIERHKMIYVALGDAMGTEIHALSINAKTLEEASPDSNNENEVSTQPVKE